MEASSRHRGGKRGGGCGERGRERRREENLFLCGAPAAALFDGRKEKKSKYEGGLATRCFDARARMGKT